jgi:hypothetical protein
MAGVEIFDKFGGARPLDRGRQVVTDNGESSALILSDLIGCSPRSAVLSENVIGSRSRSGLSTGSARWSFCTCHTREEKHSQT